jgi:glycosyltransferase involved in cell wall biosynthesis
MMRVLMTADAVGGVWTYVLELARALVPHGLFTTLATMGPRPSTDQLASAADIPSLEIVESAYQLEWMHDPWDDVEMASGWLLDLEARVHPLIVHVNGYAHGALPWRAPVVVAGHSCILSWAEAVGQPLEPSRRDRYQAVAARGLRAADWVVAPSASMLDALQRHYGPLPRTAVVANGRDDRRFRAGPKQPLVFTAGRIWDRAKNIETMGLIAPDLSWPVVVAGDGDAGPGMTHLGRVSEPALASWLGRASIFALPARYEPFGLLPLEAALAGCALVLGDTPSLRQVWGAAADFVPPDDPESVRTAIERLIQSPETLAARARAARRRALAFHPARMANEYMAVYGSAAARTDIRRRTRCAL